MNTISNHYIQQILFGLYSGFNVPFSLFGDKGGENTEANEEVELTAVELAERGVIPR